MSRQCAARGLQYGCAALGDIEHTDVLLDDHVVVHECARAHLLVVVIVVVQTLANKILRTCQLGSLIRLFLMTQTRQSLTKQCR